MPVDVDLKVKFEAFTPEQRSELVGALDKELVRQNVWLQEHVDRLAGIIAGLRPVVPAAAKGRVKCLVCLFEGKRREFRHGSGCEWHRLQRLIAKRTAPPSE